MPRDGDGHAATREFPEYSGGGGDPQAAGAPPVEPRPGGWRRGMFWAAVAAGLVVVLALTTQAAGMLPSWRNPFAQEETDRTQPPVLQSIQDLSRFVAAEGTFQVVVDLEQDRRYVPDFLLNQRTLFVGVGAVEAYVDFGQIGEDAIVVAEDGLSVEIRLPAPQLTDADLDLANSYVFAEQRGLLNRLSEVFGGDPNRQRQVYQLAEERIAAAARDSGIAERAEDNTRKMLAGLLRSLGYETVTVTFVSP
ncbi:DUF4230 domain-containing protein [Solwaraspora sp. WMMD791]|uniref:DUF4230 domain-containing protein n=1 Tax=Solwaraspora sp. WMMD791 TaxID=3016086 RepID=UPI00249CD090|nr:DUF4230 domain-containing protein [Solwaraspora sp. WMMD791]WFE30621.1 DUF4230 domain-containing protein [Solwaraspora sp. WMMD791]